MEPPGHEPMSLAAAVGLFFLGCDMEGFFFFGGVDPWKMD